MEHQVFAPLFSGVEPDRNPVAAHQISLVAVLGICVSQRLERGVRNHPEPCRIRISNYFCVGTYREGTKPDALGRKPCHWTSTLKAAMVKASRAWKYAQPRCM